MSSIEYVHNLIRKNAIYILLLCLILSYFLSLKCIQIDQYKLIEIHNQQLLSEYNERLERKNDEIETLKSIIQKMLENDVLQKERIINVYNVMTKKNMEFAKIVHFASNMYNIDEKLITLLINSESHFVEDVKHKVHYVVGVSGINLRYWKFNVESIEAQILACAHIMRIFLDMHNGDVLEALTAYKGKSPLGRRQATLIYNTWKGQ